MCLIQSYTSSVGFCGRRRPIQVVQSITFRRVLYQRRTPPKLTNETGLGTLLSVPMTHCPNHHYCLISHRSRCISDGESIISEVGKTNYTMRGSIHRSIKIEMAVDKRKKKQFETRAIVVVLVPSSLELEAFSLCLQVNVAQGAPERLFVVHAEKQSKRLPPFLRGVRKRITKVRALSKIDCFLIE